MGQEVGEYIFLESSKVKSLAVRLEVEMSGEKVYVYPQPLLQRLSVATSTKTDDARQLPFAYELCSYLPALFDRKLYQCSDKAWVKTRQIIDRGSLLHQIP